MLPDWCDLSLGLGSILLTLVLILSIKSVFYRYKRPNGKKGGLVSIHVALATSIITVIAMTTKDPYITGLSVILAYLIGRGRLDEGQHYLYQVLISGFIGITIPSAIYYSYYSRTTNNDVIREEYEEKPEKAVDDRHEADSVPELRLEDFD